MPDRPAGERTDLVCPDCGRPMALKWAHRRERWFYSCTGFPLCRTAHGAHQDSGAPLGIPAPADVRQARIAAHAAFDPLWREGPLQRKQAYAWLRRKLRLGRGECHIGRFDAETCERVVALCEDKMCRLILAGEWSEQEAPRA